MEQPKAYHGIMVSSTFSDLKEHRREVIEAIEKLGFRANVMETSGANADRDVFEQSLKMVQDSAAFVGVISHRYGQTPVCPEKNPQALSISELEFNEAMRLSRPILLFIMGDEHLIKPADKEDDPEKQAKLDAFRERAKKMREGSEVERIYEEFNSKDEFSKSAAVAIGNLSRSLAPHDDAPADGEGTQPAPPPVEASQPPHLRALPRYMGSHAFVGRRAELGILDDWSTKADPNPMLLFEAIGGSGKSMVTWTWLTKHAAEARDDWAGRFWFSFYEEGATMARFCREALAYMTGQPVEEMYKQKVADLAPRLLAELQAKPWLLVLDGLERILVAYHRIDAPQMRDEDVDVATDQIANRDPRAAIDPGDEALLRELTAAEPSKVLVSSRLTPKALINASDMPIPGVRREPLAGLRPADAEDLMRACGVTGQSGEMRAYLQTNCDCHPLVVGALAGLVNNYMPDRGNFDAWAADPQAGGKLDFTALDLTQRRNHILTAAIDDLPEKARALLQTMSLLLSGADYETLKELNPHLPPRPKEVEALKDWKENPEVLRAPAELEKTITALEQRGLLQYEQGQKLYNLHPVVRGVAAGRMEAAETGDLGTRVVDYFTSRPHDPWEEAETLEDLAPAIQIVTTLNRLERFDEAFDAYCGGLHDALYLNLRAQGEMQRLLRPLFPEGWNGPIALGSDRKQERAINLAMCGFSQADPVLVSNLSERAVWSAVSREDAYFTVGSLVNQSITLEQLGLLAAAFRISALANEFPVSGETRDWSELQAYWLEIGFGRFAKADKFWSLLGAEGRMMSDRTGNAERARYRVLDLFQRNRLTEEYLTEAENCSRQAKDRFQLAHTLALRGQWHLSRNEPGLAIGPLGEAVRLFREFGSADPAMQARHASARLRAGQAVDAGDVPDVPPEIFYPDAELAVAELWRDLCDLDRAKEAALKAHKRACGSGEPYVFRYELNQSEALLRELGVTPPEVPDYDPATDPPFDWEADVRALIERVRKKQEEEQDSD